jgi:hypothetical protein
VGAEIILVSIVIALLGLVVSVAAGWVPKPRNISTRRIYLVLLTATLTAGALTAWLALKPDPDPSPGPEPEPERWLSYSNARFGFQVEYPETWRAWEAENTDGVSFSSPRGEVRFLAYGTRVMPEDGLLPDSALKYILGQDVVVEDQSTALMQSISESGRQEFQAWIFRYSSIRGGSNEREVTITKVAQEDGRQVFISFSAPAEAFDRYAVIYEKILARAVLFDQCIECTQ